jgi:hypothetical protein
MTIIISKNGKGAVRVDKSDFELEDHLQQYIYDNPETIPLYDIKEDIRLLILAREFSTESGPIDALGVDKDGEIYLIETKLYKNPDKRTVVAQVLDYGASLWSNYRDFNNFIEQVNTYTNKDFSQNISQRLNDFFGISDEEVKVLLDSVRRNLNDGNFKFVVLMDHLHDQLRDLIVYLNNNSEFTVYAVELEYYKHKEFEILIPKLYGAEVKKDLGKSSYQSIPTDDDFINAYRKTDDTVKIKKLVMLFNDIREGRKDVDNVTVSKTPKYLNFYISQQSDKEISVSISINPKYEHGGLQFWTKKIYENDAKKTIKDCLPGVTILPDLKTQFGKIARWDFKNYKTNTFERFLDVASKV